MPRTLPGWRLELVARAPEIKHPSVVCAAPDGRVFVAEDPMDITAAADARLGRILCRHPDGRWTVFATNLHAVFGMQYLEGRLYVLHNPKFTVFRDDGEIGGGREDLIEQTNPNPWALDWNDHVPANFRLGLDGFFYVAVGDKGLYQCRGRDGSTANLHGGGILRLRPDATELEIFCTGTRNILDVAMNAEDEFFTYDNTDEHQWMGRLTHMVEGGFYGYPHDFIPRRPYTLWMMHDFGAGAACGTVVCNDDGLPAEYRGNLFLADFGKRQVTRARVERDGGSYRLVGSEDLFLDPPEDFRPVGLAFAADGRSLYLCDWQHRDVKEQGASVGRLWRLVWAGESQGAPRPAWYVPLALGREMNIPTPDLLAGLSHPAHSVRLTAQRALARIAGQARQVERSAVVAGLRGLLLEPRTAPTARWHALWALDPIDGGRTARRESLNLIRDPDVSLARQALRELGLRRVREAVPSLAQTLGHRDASLRRQAAAALGRIADAKAVPALLGAVGDKDLFARQAVFTALQRIGVAHPGTWPSIVGGLEAKEERVREGVSFALRDAFDVKLVDALQSVLAHPERVAGSHELALRSLAGLAHQPPEWNGDWWAYHPAKAPPPERQRTWAGTDSVLRALRRFAIDAPPPLRLIALEALGTARDIQALPMLRRVFSEDPDPGLRRAALVALARHRDPESRGPLSALLRNPREDRALLAEAVRVAPDVGGAEVITALAGLLERSASSLPASFRLSVLESLRRAGGGAAVSAMRQTLHASAVDERRLAIRALGQWRDTNSLPELLVAWLQTDTRADALSALCRLGDARALDAYVEGLGSADPSVREACRKALVPLRAAALPAIESRAGGLSVPVLSELRKVYADDPTTLQKPMFAGAGRVPEVAEYERYAAAHPGDAANGRRLFFNEQGVACVRCHLVNGQGGSVGPDLTQAGTQFSRAQLIESVLYPSRAVREGYQQILVDVKGEETVSGALKADTADGLTLVDAGGRTNFVPRASILDRRTSELSLMPEGLQVGLTLDEFADVIAFLESRKAPEGRGTGRGP